MVRSISDKVIDPVFSLTLLILAQHMIICPMTQKILRLGPWDEVCGVLQHVVEDDPFTILNLGWIRVQISSTEVAAIKDRLERAIGKRISILRTDIPEKPLLLRIVADE